MADLFERPFQQDTATHPNSAQEVVPKGVSDVFSQADFFCQGGDDRTSARMSTRALLGVMHGCPLGPQSLLALFGSLVGFCKVCPETQIQPPLEQVLVIHMSVTMGPICFDEIVVPQAMIHSIIITGMLMHTPQLKNSDSELFPKSYYNSPSKISCGSHGSSPGQERK